MRGDPRSCRGIVAGDRRRGGFPRARIARRQAQGRSTRQDLRRPMTIALWLAATAVAGTQQPAPGVLKPCKVAGLESLVTSCATIRVRENRSIASGRMLGIRVVVVPPDSGAELADPIVPVPGGPGGGTIGAGNGWARAPTRARGPRALILIAPRGYGVAGELDCDFSDGRDHPSSYVRDFAPPAKVRECADSLSRRADLRQYHTEPIADDLAEVLTALAYERVNLYGVSGGTRQAFVFASRYPDRKSTRLNSSHVSESRMP